MRTAGRLPLRAEDSLNVVEELFDTGGDGDEAFGGDFGEGVFWGAAGGA
jgi:hypothetical protein